MISFTYSLAKSLDPETRTQYQSQIVVEPSSSGHGSENPGILRTALLAVGVVSITLVDREYNGGFRIRDDPATSISG